MQECPTSCALPACFCRSPNLFSLVGKMFVPSARVVNTLDYGGVFQKPFSNAEVPLSTDRVSKTSENFGEHYQGLASDEVVPATACTAGGAAPATLSMHSVWPNSKIPSALPDQARSPRVTKPDSDCFPANTGTSAIGAGHFVGYLEGFPSCTNVPSATQPCLASPPHCTASNSGGMPADVASPVHIVALQTAISPMPRIGVPIPPYSDYGNQMSGNVFLLALRHVSTSKRLACVRVQCWKEFSWLL